MAARLVVSLCFFNILLNIDCFNTEDDRERYGHPEKDSRHARRDGRGRGNHQDDRRNAQTAQPPRGGFANVPTGPRADRMKSSNGPSSSATPTPAPSTPSGNGTLPESSTPHVPPMTENELTALRDRYLGVTNKKRKIRKMNDRKFVFDWAEEEDTFASDSPIAVGANRQGAQVMFGRGRVGGMDDGGAAYSGVGAEGNLVDAMERRKAAKSGIDERHWSDKPLPEMKERDWRIFREDFSIAARGEHLLHRICCKCY